MAAKKPALSSAEEQAAILAAGDTLALKDPSLLNTLSKGAKKAQEQPLQALSAKDRKSKIDALSDKLNKKLKFNAIRTADTILNPWALYRRPTGILQLDVLTGGGFPVGGAVQISGEASAAKTYIALMCLAATQRASGENFSGFIVSFEPFDAMYARRCGLIVALDDYSLDKLERDLNRRLSDSEIKILKTQIGSFKVIDGMTYENALDTCVDLVESNLFQVGCIDSLGVITLEGDMEKGLDESGKVAGASQLITRWVNKLVAAYRHDYELPNGRMEKNRTTLIMLQHRRIDLKATGDNAIRLLGGEALKHLKMQDIHLRKKSEMIFIPADKANAKDSWRYKRTIGLEIDAKLHKTKVSASYGGTCTLEFFNDLQADQNPNNLGIPRIGVDTCRDAFNAAITAGVITQSGSWYSLSHPELGDIRTQGASGMIEALRSDQRILEHVWFSVLKSANITGETHHPAEMGSE